MNKPVWIVSCSIFAFILLFLCFAAWYRVELPKAVPLTPKATTAAAETVPQAFDHSFIYLNDLFKTYIPPIAKEEEVQLPPVPTVPAEVVIPVPDEGAPKFLEPLSVTLTGTMIVGDVRKDRAIIMDNKTKQEINYRVGDIVEDAQVVAIYPSRVLLVRSNGQQEFLYLTQEEIARVQERVEVPDWSAIVKQHAGFYTIDKDEFAREVKNVSRLIDIFDLATAYKNGISIGSRIGQIKDISLPFAMGLRSGDIITSFNGLPTRTTAERMKIIDATAVLGRGSEVVLAINRNNRQMTLMYKIDIINARPTEEAAITTSESVVQTMAESESKRVFGAANEQEKMRILNEKYKFAPTAEEIEKEERQQIASIRRL